MNVTIAQIVRPIKLAFFIKPGNSKSYLRAVKLCTSLWGGACFPILPFYKILPRAFRRKHQIDRSTHDFYQGTLANFDPDIIVIDDKLDLTAVVLIASERHTVTFDQVEQSFEANEEGYGLGAELLLRSLKEKEFKYQRTDSLQIRFAPATSSNLFQATLFGIYTPILLPLIKGAGMPKRYFSAAKIRNGRPDGYYEDDTLTALDVTLHGLNNVDAQKWSSKTALLLLNPDRLEDLMLFWNLRAMGWNMLAVPIAAYQDKFWVTRIQRQQQLFHSHFNLDSFIYILAGSEISREDVYKAQQFLNTIQVDPAKGVHYSHHWTPRFWLSAKNLGYDAAWAISPEGPQKEFVFDWDMHSVLQVSVITPPFDVSSYRSKKHCFTNEVQYTVDGMQPQYAQVLPDLPSGKLERLTRWGYGQWRFSPNGHFFLADGWNKKIDISMPLAERVFEEWFAHHNLTVQYSAAGKLAKQLLINIGNMYGVNMFANPGLLPILTLFEGGKIVNKETLLKEANKQFNLHDEHFRVRTVADVIDGLLKKGVIQAGFKVQCSFCNQHSFYTVSELNERLRCTVCQNTYPAPIHNPDEIKWSYRGLGPFSRNNRAEGIIAVLLTLRFFRITLVHDALISAMLSFDIREQDKVINEVDLALFYKEFKHSSQPTDLFFCECKTEIDFQDKDVERMKRLGIRFPGSVLVFATLKTQLSLPERAAIGKLVKYFRKGLKSRPRNPVLILTGKELLNRLFGLQHFRDEMYRYNHSSDTVGRLCDLTCREYLGIETHESVYSKFVNERWEKYHADQAHTKAVLSGIMQSLANRPSHNTGI